MHLTETNGPNQALERTGDRRDILLSMTLILKSKTQLAASSCFSLGLMIKRLLLALASGDCDDAAPTKAPCRNGDAANSNVKPFKCSR